MIRAFGYLIGRSARNRISRRLRRLRRPRYLVALILGLAYLWIVVVRQRPGPGSGAEPAWIGPAAALAVAGVMAWSWIFAAERRVLAFTPAEVTFLFPAPVTRRQLIHFKLLRSQLVILLNTVLWTLILSRDRFGSGVWLRAVAVWVLLTTLSLHRLGASFVRGSLAAHGASGLRRRAGSLAVLTMVLVGAVWVVLDARPLLVAGWNTGVDRFFQAVGATLDRPPARILLAPFAAAIGPLLADDAAEWVRAIGPALGILLLHYVWVVRSDVAFEEAAAESSLRRADALASGAARRGARRIGRDPPPYHLRPGGSPAGAILWKNLVAVTRTGRPRRIALGLAAAGAGLAALSFYRDGAPADIAGWLAAMWGGFLLVIGPQWIRSDLRGDMPNLALLRSYPLPGRAVVAAEVAASTMVLTSLQLGVFTVAYLAFLGNRFMEPDLAIRTMALGAALLLLPALNLLGLLIHNGIAMLYPDWVGPAPGRAGGVEALGQNMLALTGYLVLLSIALLLPIAIGAAVFVLLRNVPGWWAAAPALAAGLAAAGAEAWLIVGWIGRAFERTDPATAGLA